VGAGAGGSTTIASGLERSGPFALVVPPATDTLKFTITQMNFIEENGRKVFYLGFQEVDLQFVEWDATPTSLSPDTATDSHIILTFDAPPNKYITDLNSIKVNGDVNRIDFFGFDVGDLVNPVATTTNVLRVDTNDCTEFSIGLAYPGSDDIVRVELHCWVNGNPLEVASRNDSALYDTLDGIALKINTKDV